MTTAQPIDPEILAELIDGAYRYLVEVTRRPPGPDRLLEMDRIRRDIRRLETTFAGTPPVYTQQVGRADRRRPAMTEEELTAIEAKAAAASPGPWIKVTEYDPEDGVDVYDRKVGVVAEADLKQWDGEWDLADASVARPFGDKDATFIAAARNDVPALCAEVRRLCQQIAAMQKAAEENSRLRRNSD